MQSLRDDALPTSARHRFSYGGVDLTVEHVFGTIVSSSPQDYARSGVPEPNDCTDQELLLTIDAVNGLVCASQRELFRFIAEVDRRELWQGSGARDMAHWLVMRYGISYWKASRWIQASLALNSLPLIAKAFISGELGIDKVVELTRFATPENEAGLVVWAQGVSCGCIREKADFAHRSLEEAQEAEQARSLS